MIRLGVTGTDTDVGKTFVSVVLLKLMKSRGLRVAAMKPVETGVGAGDPRADAPQQAAHLLVGDLVGDETLHLAAAVGEGVVRADEGDLRVDAFAPARRARGAAARMQFFDRFVEGVGNIGRRPAASY